MTLDRTGKYEPEKAFAITDVSVLAGCEEEFEAACAAEPLAPAAAIREWLGRVPAEEHTDLLPDLVAIHLTAAWRAGIEPPLNRYVEEFGNDFPSFASLTHLPAEVLKADLLARYEFAPHLEHRTIEERARELGRPDLVNLLREAMVGASGRYVLLSMLGTGGMGVVFKCHDQQLRRLAAIKFPRPGVVWNAHARERLAQEARGTAGLNHPGIVSVYEFDESDPDRPFYVMRMVLGETLLNRIRAHHVCGAGNRGLRDLLQILISTCETLAYAHSRRVSHRDLKPGNVKVGEFGEVTVLDWGLIKILPAGASDSLSTNLTPDAVGSLTETPPGKSGLTPPEESGSGVVGSPAYMSPEQARGHSTAASDVFGLGAILYEILTDRPPYVEARGAGLVGLLKCVEMADFPAPGKVARQPVPRALQAVCLKAMARHPADRYDSPSALAADLHRWLTDEPVLARREWPHHKVLRFVRRHTGVSVLLALMALGVIAGTLVWQENRAEQARTIERELDNRASAAERELDVAEGLIATGELDRARSVLTTLVAQLDGPERLRGSRERGQRTLARVDGLSQLERERQIRIPDFHRRADEAEFHLLGALWTLLPHEETRDSHRIGYDSPRSPDLLKGIEGARQALGLYGLADSADATQQLRDAGLAIESVERLRQRAGELLFLWALAVERLAQGGPIERGREACHEALRLLDGAARMGNDSHSLHRHRALVSTRLGDAVMARVAHEAAKARPDATFLDHHLHGIARSREKQYEAAIAAYQQALTIRVQNYWTLFRLAKTLELEGTQKNDPVYLGQSAATFAACAGLRPDDPTAHNNQGIVLLSLKRYPDAVVAFEKAIRVDPGYLMAWGNLGLAHAGLHDPTAAREVLKRFTEQPGINQRTPGARHEHARLLVNVGLAYERVLKYKESIEYATLALERDAENVDALYNRAIGYEKTLALDGAEADVRKAISLRPDDGRSHYLLGNVLAARGRTRDAVAAFDRAIELSPKRWDAWYNRGVVLRRLGRDQEALRDQSQVIRNRPDYALAYFERAMLQARAQRYRGAMDDADTFLAFQPDDVPGLILRGQIACDLGQDLAMSERDLTLAIKLEPANPNAYRARGVTRSRARNWAGCMSDYREYLRLRPSAPDAAAILNNVAIAHQNAGEVQEALEDFAEAIRLTPSATLLCNRGSFYLEQGDLIRATRDFDAAIHLDRAFHRAWGLRAQARLRIEDWAGAIADLNRAEQLVPGYYEMLTFRGFAHYAAGDVTAAHKDLMHVVTDRPDHVRGKFCRGALALLDGRPGEAVEGLGFALDDPTLAPYARILLARAWLQLPGSGTSRATRYADELIRIWPKDAAAFLVAARTYAIAANHASVFARFGLREQAMRHLDQAVKVQPDLIPKLTSETAFESLQKDSRFPR